jgi:hypothetical protein
MQPKCEFNSVYLVARLLTVGPTGSFRRFPIKPHLTIGPDENEGLEA